MRFFVLSLVLHVKKIAKCRAFLVAIISLPIFLIALGNFLRDDGAIVSVSVGVYFEQEHAEVIQILDEVDFPDFIFYDSIELLKDDVRTGRLECGYIFPADIGGLVTVVTSPSTIAAPVINDIIAMAVLRVMAESITVDILNTYFENREDIEYFAAWQFARYNEMDIFMQPLLIGGDGYDPGAVLQQSILVRLTRGIIGLHILTLALFVVHIFIEEWRGSLIATLAARKKLVAFELSLFFAISLALFAVGAVGVLAVSIWHPYILGAVSAELAAMAVFTVICSAVVVALVRCPWVSGVVINFALFIILANIIFGGVIIDLGEIAPWLRYIQRVFPLFWYTSY